MKVIETRQVTEEVKLMSWSPKMDLIVMGSETGEVFLHRLTWQRIWIINLNSANVNNKPSNEPVVPNLITWHPEGIFLSIASGKSTFIIDVESGKIVHNHEMPSNIVAMNWCSSKYDVSSDEAIAAQPRQQPDFLRNDLKIQRLESQLSVLLISTDNGLVYTYSGGFLIASIMKIPLPLSSLPFPTSENQEQKFDILHVNATRDLESFVFLVSLQQQQQQPQQVGEDPEVLPSSPSPLATVIKAEEESTNKEKEANNNYLCVSHFRNEMIEKIAPVLGPLGFKYLFFMKNWSLIQAEFLNLQEGWTKLVDIYKNYMTYGNEKEFEEVRADYMELLFTGISTVEMEIYLGKGGREKEVKRNTTTMNSVHGSMTDHLKNIKSALVSMSTELNELGGFLCQVARESDAKPIIIELRKSFSYLYLAALHIQSLAETFLDVFHDFIHLILNTIHLINIQETPDYNEEDADVEKILKFLDMKIEKDVFDFLLVNAPIIFKKPTPCLEPIQIPKVPSMPRKIMMEIERERRENPKKFPFIYNNNSDKTNSNSRDSRDWESFPEFISDFMKKEMSSHQQPQDLSFIGQDFMLDFSQEKVLQLFEKLTPTIDELMTKLFKIPALCTLPFKAETFPIAELPLKLPSLLLHEEEQELEEQASSSCTTLHLKDVTGLLTTTTSSSKDSLVYLIWDPSTIYLFDYNFTSPSPTIKARCLNFSMKVTCCSFFCELSSATPNVSKNYLSVLTYDDDFNGSKMMTPQPPPSERHGRSILCQINLEKIDDTSADALQIDIKKFQNYVLHQTSLNKPKESATASGSTTSAATTTTTTTTAAQMLMQGMEPVDVHIEIPRDVSKTSANVTSCPCLDYAFPIEGFHSTIMAVSGARHVGAFMAENKRSILLLDMELEVPDNSFDDDNTNSEFLSQTISEVTL